MWCLQLAVFLLLVVFLIDLIEILFELLRGAAGPVTGTVGNALLSLGHARIPVACVSEGLGSLLIEVRRLRLFHEASGGPSSKRYASLRSTTRFPVSGEMCRGGGSEQHTTRNKGIRAPGSRPHTAAPARGIERLCKTSEYATQRHAYCSRLRRETSTTRAIHSPAAGRRQRFVRPGGYLEARRRTPSSCRPAPLKRHNDPRTHFLSEPGW